MRLLFAVPEPGSIELMHSILDSALCLTPLNVSFTETRTVGELRTRVGQKQDDVILLDWDMAESDTPELVKEMLTTNPKLRVVVLLPQSNRQYRQQVWEAGA